MEQTQLEHGTPLGFRRPSLLSSRAGRQHAVAQPSRSSLLMHPPALRAFIICSGTTSFSRLKSAETLQIWKSCRHGCQSRFCSTGERSALPPVCIGDIRESERRFTSHDVAEYARIGGDLNPIHVCKEAAAKAGFKDTVVHGLLYAGLFPAIIGNHFPGAIYVSQTLRFTHPVLTDDLLRATVEVTDVSVYRKRFRVTFLTTCQTVGEGVQVLKGTAVALLPAAHTSTESGTALPSALQLPLSAGASKSGS